MKNKGNPYRHLLSGLFLALYMFITLPVQYWHDHPLSTYMVEKEDTPHSIVQSNGDNNLGIDCSICSHEYSVYCSEIDQKILTILEPESVFNAGYTQSFISQVLDGLSNKGPPALA